MAGYIELYLDQGADFENTITLSDDTSNSSINISGYSFSAQARRSPYSRNVPANIICTTVNAANGTVLMSISAANTANMKAGHHVFDVTSTDNFGSKERVLEGIIEVSPRVSR